MYNCVHNITAYHTCSSIEYSSGKERAETTQAFGTLVRGSFVREQLSQHRVVIDRLLAEDIEPVYLPGPIPQDPALGEQANARSAAGCGREGCL